MTENIEPKEEFISCPECGNKTEHLHFIGCCFECEESMKQWMQISLERKKEIERLEAELVKQKYLRESNKGEFEIWVDKFKKELSAEKDKVKRLGKALEDLIGIREVDYEMDCLCKTNEKKRCAFHDILIEAKEALKEL